MSDIDESLEQLLGKAAPRAMPDAAGTAATRDAVHADWQAVSRGHRRRIRMRNFAVAATVLIGIFAMLNSFRVADVDVVQVASIQKSFGSIYILGEQSTLTLATNLKAIHAGQTIVTGDDAGAALAWGQGGILRLDESTKIEFRNGKTVYLQSGRIYFDSTPSNFYAGINNSARDGLQVETDFGEVSHHGTQFMTQVEPDKLTVSVREGRVTISNEFYPMTVQPGNQVSFVGRARPVVLSIPTYGAAWDWIGESSPSVSLDGKSTHAFLKWAGRELGREVVFASAETEQNTKDETLVGDIDRAPAEELRLRMATTDFEWGFEEGVIYVDAKE